MKKYIAAAVALAAFAGFSFAQAPAAPQTAAPVKNESPRPAKKEMRKAEFCTGTITAVDTVKNEITVKDEKGTDKVLGADAAKLSALKVGENVKIKVKDNRAEMIKVIKKHEGKKLEAKK